MLQIVFATTTTTVSNGPGSHIVIHEGEHWWASDPIVKAHRGLFTKDSSHGLCSSVALPEDAAEQAAPVLTDAWAELIRQADEAGIDGKDVLMVAKNSDAGRAIIAAAAKDLDETQPAVDKETADARESEAAVEQATKAPGEKSNARRQGTRRA
jgi:hypothetical protein